MLQVENIKTMIENLETQQTIFINEIEAARQEYENEVEELKQAFDTATAEEKKAFEENITKAFEEFQRVLGVMEKQYNDQLAEVMAALQIKKFGLRDASMNQRSMMLSLFVDKCDTMTYNSFHICNEQDVPMMSDDFGTLLLDLKQIEWDTLTSTEDFPVPPVEFSAVGIKLIDNESLLDFPVQTLKDTGRLQVNLKLSDPSGDFDDFWRVRISKIQFTLLQADGKPLPSPGTDQGQEVRFEVVYPTVFNDTNENGEIFTFIAQELKCQSYYVTEIGMQTFKMNIVRN